MKWGHKCLNKDSLLNTLNKATANATDVYFELYTSYFENGNEPEEALKIILEYPKEIGDSEDKNSKNITWQDENKNILIFEDIINGTAKRIAEMNLTKGDFYKKLYTVIFNSDDELFPQNKEQKVIALKILSERVKVVPYYQVIETDKVSREEFNEGINRLRPSIQEAFYMLRRRYVTTPERAAQILRIADNLLDKKDKIIFWTLIISELLENSAE